MPFASLGLAPELVRAVADEGYTEPTPIQQEAIPLALGGRDLIGSAQTGTGKTAAFMLPILQRLAPGERHALRALILVPTRELAEQVLQSARAYGRHLHLSAAAIYGGVGMEPQTRALAPRGGDRARDRRGGQAPEAGRTRPHPAGEARRSDARVHADQVRRRQARDVPEAGGHPRSRAARRQGAEPAAADARRVPQRGGGRARRNRHRGTRHRRGGIRIVVNYDVPAD